MDLTAPSPPTPHQLPPNAGDRLLAALAYFGYLAGLWLLAPIAVYFLRRRHSRFVAHHAIIALLVHLMLVPLGALLTALGFSLAIAVVTILEGSMGPDAPVLEAALVAVGFTALAPVVITVAITLVAALRAYQGHLDPHTRLGRASESLLRQDPGVSDQ